ncbi:uncharacterized protein LOC107620555 [Arachis ipaensis]|uniref:uncharacterized protein LOC107620555 n=1 Tax=Arachis ipaensis TaxID=130454 RepID=UPI0007AFE049|nr:uncharacterized protein LOC107620555 [Arachis ipaensis]
MIATMQATAEATDQQVNNGNGGNGENGPMTLATFLKINPPTFRRIINPTKADNWFQAMERALQAQQVSEDQCVEFATYQLMGGLWSDILSTVGPLEIRTFFELVNKSRVAEDCVRKAVLDKGDHRAFGRGKGKQIENPPNNLTCRRCGAYHLNTPCGARQGICYYYGGAGHLSWNCLENKRQEAERVQQQGRVFTMSADSAERSDTLIRDRYEIGRKILIALFDIGASHLFILFEKASELGLKITMLTYDLQVHTPAFEAVVTRLGC